MSGSGKRKRPTGSDSKSTAGMAHIVDLSGDGNGGGADVLWQCSVCTLENESYSAACAACGTPRPDEGGSGGSGGSSSGASDGWTCTVCTYANDNAHTACGMCGTDKVSD